jgi:hypothetical protein
MLENLALLSSAKNEYEDREIEYLEKKCSVHWTRCRGSGSGHVRQRAAASSTGKFPYLISHGRARNTSTFPSKNATDTSCDTPIKGAKRAKRLGIEWAAPGLTH